MLCLDLTPLILLLGSLEIIQLLAELIKEHALEAMLFSQCVMPACMLVLMILLAILALKRTIVMQIKLLITVLLATIAVKECLTQLSKPFALLDITVQQELKNQSHAHQALSLLMKETFRKMIVHLALQDLFVIEMITSQLNALKVIIVQWEKTARLLALLELTILKKNKS